MKKFGSIILIVLCLTVFAFFAVASDDSSSDSSGNASTDTSSEADDVESDDGEDETISEDTTDSDEDAEDADDKASSDDTSKSSEDSSSKKSEDSSSKSSGGSSSGSSSSSSSKKTDEVTVKVTDKSNQEADILSGRYSDRVNFVFEVTNNTKKDIQGVKGVLTINDLFGDKIMSQNCNFTGQVISAGETVVFDNLGFDVNEFITSNTKVYNEKYENLSFSYKVSEVVYADSSSESSSSGSKTTGSSEVTVTCTDKTNQAADVWNGIYLPRCYFTLVFQNNTSKNIKGVKGVMTVSDLFGTKIKSFNCDFTSETIPAGGSVTVDNLYLEINELLSDEKKLYSQNYEDLQFSYKVSDIVYE